MSAYEISIVSIIGINVILAVSLNMISGFCGQISLGHGAFFGAGAYAAALAMVGTASVPLAIIAAAGHGQPARYRRRLCLAARADGFSRGHDHRREFPVRRLRPKAGLARRRDGDQRHSRDRPRRRRQHDR